MPFPLQAHSTQAPPSALLDAQVSACHASANNLRCCCVCSSQEHARDSFENVLFSLCRFFELTGHYPAQVTAVSYTLKQQRFEQLHRAAVRFPAKHFHFIGTAVPEGASGAAAVSPGLSLLVKVDLRVCRGPVGIGCLNVSHLFTRSIPGRPCQASTQLATHPSA